jgi:hypothetical protein
MERARRPVAMRVRWRLPGAPRKRARSARGRPAFPRSQARIRHPKRALAAPACRNPARRGGTEREGPNRRSPPRLAAPAVVPRGGSPRRGYAPHARLALGAAFPRRRGASCPWRIAREGRTPDGPTGRRRCADPAAAAPWGRGRRRSGTPTAPVRPRPGAAPLGPACSADPGRARAPPCQVTALRRAPGAGAALDPSPARLRGAAPSPHPKALTDSGPDLALRPLRPPRIRRAILERSRPAALTTMRLALDFSMKTMRPHGDACARMACKPDSVGVAPG